MRSCGELDAESYPRGSRLRENGDLNSACDVRSSYPPWFVFPATLVKALIDVGQELLEESKYFQAPGEGPRVGAGGPDERGNCS